MSRAALLSLSAVVLLAGCSPTGASAPAPGAAAPIDGPHLRAEGVAFDPVAHDVDPGAECEGRAGREALAVLDRAAWPELGVAAGEAVMRCGSADGAGWRHIADGHTGDFGELAELVGAGWEDVAWFAIDRALEQPTRVEEYRDDILNYDVLVELVDGGEATRSWMVTVGVGLGSGQVITAFPDEQR
ncbi:hypothetical protein [Agrococcus sp. TF02-05]|uniref:hypothetical protein n=1 Tax=Agrococcus sp. TF02-05 TaxID=2815211 RepID=UPI001AA114BF|nr:hypothetical protein [Agrococcus sp. TF02-05]MBO1770210.1 hypothetical protein [Agrococcus sp. TF02-05]